MSTRARRTKFTLQSPPTAQDAAGQLTGNWTTVATVYGDLRHPNGLEAINGGGEVSVVRASIRLGHRAGVTSAMRLVQGSTTYEIKAVLPDARKRWLDVVGEVVNVAS